MGLLVVGVGFFAAYVVQVGLVRLVVGKLIGFTSQPANLGAFSALLISAGIILIFLPLILSLLSNKAFIRES